jgi:hypothetical protein
MSEMAKPAIAENILHHSRYVSTLHLFVNYFLSHVVFQDTTIIKILFSLGNTQRFVFIGCRT